jgi:hypothetical protein
VNTKIYVGIGSRSTPQTERIAEWVIAKIGDIQGSSGQLSAVGDGLFKDWQQYQQRLYASFAEEYPRPVAGGRARSTKRSRVQLVANIKRLLQTAEAEASPAG